MMPRPSLAPKAGRYLLKRKRPCPGASIFAARPSIFSSENQLTSFSTSSQCCDNHGDEGIVEGVFLFHRHGDRAPARRLVPDAYAEHEMRFWEERVPKGASLYDSLSGLFPTDIHFSNNDGKFFDTRRAPSGFLTWKGMEQMRIVGQACALRYSRLGYQAADGSNNMGSMTGRQVLLKYWDIQAFSTCYLRTVKSVQCFLHGLLGTEKQKSYEDYQGCEVKAQTLRNEIALEAARERPVDPNDLINVYVRDRSIDTLNAFDRNPDLMRDLVSEVVNTAHFQKYDALAKPLASKLSDLLPGLLAPGQKLFGGPSGINWIHAADHFICRSSHGLPFSKFCSDQANEDRRIEEALASMHRPVIQHLAWRFRQWYKSPPLLAAIAAPPLREIEGQIRRTIESDGGSRAPMVVYSCHDVTILSLLYGLGAEFLEHDNSSEWKLFWPSYASTLVIELVRIKEGKDDVDDTHKLRILMNGKQVRIAAVRNESQKDQVLRLSDFTAIIDDLEEAGGWGENGRLADDPACSSVKRDMSGWTG